MLHRDKLCCRQFQSESRSHSIILRLGDDAFKRNGVSASAAGPASDDGKWLERERKEEMEISFPSVHPLLP